MEYVCSKCGRRESTSTRKPACECGGLWKLDWQPPKYDDSLIDKNEWSLFRYRKFMALEDDSWKDISLGEGMTPIVKLDEDVLLKMDYFMPTLSFKDRGAAVLVAHCKSIGVDNVVQDSIGGRDVRDYTLESLMSHISVVFQHVYLFADTIENNIQFLMRQQPM